MGQLGHLQWESMTVDPICSGTIIGRYHALTAGSCLHSGGVEGQFASGDLAFTPGQDKTDITYPMAFVERYVGGAHNVLDPCTLHCHPARANVSSAPPLPFHDCTHTCTLRSVIFFTEWLYEGDWSYNSALLILDSDVGGSSGWLPVKETDILLRSKLVLVGYPDDKPAGTQ